jgi:PAS domain S-box-containing protein
MSDAPVDADHPSTAGRVVCVGPALGPVANALEACGHRVDHVEDFPAARRTLGDAVEGDGVRVLCDAATLENRDTDRCDDVWRDVDVTVVDGQHPATGRDDRPAGETDAPDRSPRDPGPIDGTISEELKRRAMEEAPVGITVADLARPDEPLVYINDAFERLTGYAEAETLGRNCRFLQGPDSNEEARRTMREAVDAGEGASVEIKNYRKDGERFWNRVDIAPIDFEDGAPRHYVGFQTDVTRRKRAERAAEQHAAALERERQTLTHVLDRIDGLLSEVTSMLVRSDATATVRQELCACLTAVEPYAYAWVGTRELAADAIRPRAEAGDGPDALDDLAIPVDGDDPVANALRTGRLQVATVGDDPFHGDDRFDAYATLVAVPLSSSGGEQGVAVIYLVGEPPEGFDDREKAVLRAVGRTVATGLAAIARGRSLATDEVIELTFSVSGGPPFAVDLARAHDCRLAYAGAAESADGGRLVFFDVSGATPEEVAAFAGNAPDVRTVRCLRSDDSGAVFEFALTDEGYFPGELAANAVKLREFVAEPDGARLVVDLPRDADARAVVAAVEDRYPGADLTAYHERERSGRTRREFLVDAEDRLTSRQLTALRKAFHSGFFEWPHATSGDELADSMGISRSTFHQHLRAAERKLVGEFFSR